MKNYVYYSPTRLVIGKDAELDTGMWVKKYGGTRVLVHHDDQWCKTSGLVDRVIKSIEDAGLKAFEFSGVVPNPRLENAKKGIELGKKEGIDFVVAVGGGSVIDSAKCIALGIPYDGDVWDFYLCDENGSWLKEPETALPKGIVLTMPASGSEGSNSSVITKWDENLKRFCDCDLNRAMFAIENPELTMSLPAFQTSCGILDIISHSLERFFAHDKGNELSDHLCEAIFKTCLTCARVLKDNPTDYDARANIMVAGTLSHNGLTGIGRQDDWATHMLEHEFSGEFDVTHGAGLAVLFPAWMKYVWKEDPELFIKFATRVMGVGMDYDHPDLVCLEGINRFERFIREDLGLPTRISEMRNAPTVTEESMWKMAKRVRVTNDVGTTGWFKKLSHEDMVNIYKLAL